MKTYCVATAVLRDGDKYFIAKRAKTKKIAPDIWEFVTGFVEDHEAAEDTILREMMEEINVSGVIIQALDILQMHTDQEHWIVLPFLIHPSSHDITTKPEEHSAGRWATWEELETMADGEFRYDVDQLRYVMEPDRQ